MTKHDPWTDLSLRRRALQPGERCGRCDADRYGLPQDRCELDVRNVQPFAKPGVLYRRLPDGTYEEVR